MINKKVTIIYLLINLFWALAVYVSGAWATETFNSSKWTPSIKEAAGIITLCGSMVITMVTVIHVIFKSK